MGFILLSHLKKSDMNLVLENIENNNPVTQNEFEQWAGVLYGSISVSNTDSKPQILQNL